MKLDGVSYEIRMLRIENDGETIKPVNYLNTESNSNLYLLK